MFSSLKESKAWSRYLFNCILQSQATEDALSAHLQSEFFMYTHVQDAKAAQAAEFA